MCKSSELWSDRRKMYLINVTTLRLEYVPEEPVSSSYAMLSHRWRDEKVTFQDMQDGACQDKAGYEKIEKTCELAHADGFKYVWIDTCCIDKSSSAELSEAINSMFKWYQNSGMCYVYMYDVNDLEDLAESDWFTRGWTLQELIAPIEMRFLGKNWNVIGEKRNLMHQLVTITGIPDLALAVRGGFRGYSVAQRMCWAAKRRTTRREDRAYSLIGLFDVNMPLLYGEGERAFIRLQEEVIKHSDDQSIFAWAVDNKSQFTSLLAPSPDNFWDCSNIYRHENPVYRTPFSMTNKGISIELHRIALSSLEMPETKYIAMLDCELRSAHAQATIGIFIHSPDESGLSNFRRTHYFGKDKVVFNAQTFLPGSKLADLPMRFMDKVLNLEETMVSAEGVTYLSPSPMATFFGQKDSVRHGYEYPWAKSVVPSIRHVWIRKMPPYYNPEIILSNRNESLSALYQWDSESRSMKVPEGLQLGTTLSMLMRGTAQSLASTLQPPTPEKVGSRWKDWWRLRRTFHPNKQVGDTRPPTVLLSIEFAPDFEPEILMKTLPSDSKTPDDFWSHDWPIGRDRLTLGQERKKPWVELSFSVGNFFLFTKFGIVDGEDTLMIDVFTATSTWTCHECGEISVGGMQLHCLVCESFVCCRKCFRKITYSQHDASVERKKHRFRILEHGARPDALVDWREPDEAVDLMLGLYPDMDLDRMLDPVQIRRLLVRDNDRLETPFDEFLALRALSK